MKKLLPIYLFLCCLFISSNSIAQDNGFTAINSDQRSTPVQNIEQPTPKTTTSSCDYILDDGISENSLGLTSGGDIMWLNAFTASSGCETITQISVAWGSMSNGGQCRVILYNDPNNDGDPSDAVYITEATTTIANAGNNIFKTVNITPTTVSGGFFVAALVQNQIAGEYPAPIDQTTSQGSSWVVGESINGDFDVNNLVNNDIGPFLIDNIGYAGNMLLRCNGGAPSTPVSSWALVVGLLLIFGFIVVRYRTRLA